MKDWNDDEIECGHSTNGVTALSHPLKNLVSGGVKPWPPPEIIQKLHRSGHARHFQGNDLQVVTRKTGYYCDLQSIHSEDALTWSVFGILAHSDLRIRQRWSTEFLALLGLGKVSTSCPEFFLWRRIPHPDTDGGNGPEIDFGILTENVVILGESKWLSGVDDKQGKCRNKNQIQLRVEWLQKYTCTIWPQASIRCVVGVGVERDCFPSVSEPGIDVKPLTWRDVCGIGSHPNAAELVRYLKWKMSHTKWPKSSKHRVLPADDT